MLDSPPCSDSATCYAQTTPVVLHSIGGILTKVSEAWRKSDGTYLAQNSSLNNQFVPNAAIALNAIGYDSQLASFYSSFSEVPYDEYSDYPTFCYDSSLLNPWGCYEKGIYYYVPAWVHYSKVSLTIGVKFGSLHHQYGKEPGYWGLIKYILVP